MIHNESRFSKFDKALLAFSVAVLVIALFLLPKESFRLIKQELGVSQNWTEYLKHGEISRLSTEFEAENPNLSLVYRDEDGDVIAFSAPVTNEAAPELENIAEVASFINILYYNIDMLKEAGFDRPPKNRNEFIDAAIKIENKAKNIRGMGFSGNVFEDILPWFWSAGVNGDWKSRASVGTLEFLQKLGESNIAGEEIFNSKMDDKLSFFCAGKCAFYIGSTLDIAIIEEKSPKFEWNLTAIPTPENYAGKPVFNVTSWEIGVSPLSEQKEEALIFLEFINSRRDFIAQAAGAVPSDNAGEQQNPKDPLRLKARTLFEGAEIIHDTEFFNKPEQAAILFKNELIKLWRGEQSPKEAAAALDSSFNTDT
ncbi:MAG: hypothetical protein Pg6A_10480 [Termitinemataceae bacterium]|nr:MAG: hypothetical protein Pg6A_10480 [Termitinemataceae bacterium]